MSIYPSEASVYDTTALLSFAQTAFKGGPYLSWVSIATTVLHKEGIEIEFVCAGLIFGSQIQGNRSLFVVKEMITKTAVIEKFLSGLFMRMKKREVFISSNEGNVKN